MTELPPEIESLSPNMQEQAMDLMALAAEELDPELAQWVEDGPLGPMLKHPLVYDITGVHVPGIPNRQFRYKKKALARATEERDWHTVVFLHERPYRASALFRVVQEHGAEMTDADYWKLVGRVWVDSENIWQNTLEWDVLLGSERGERQAIMTPDAFDDDDADLAMYRALPETVTVYRGAQDGVNEVGLSWTTDRKTAVWFARRFADRRDGDPVVLTGLVNKSDVVACFTGRGESEVVVVEGTVSVQTIEDA
jgi:hypothetical protein